MTDPLFTKQHVELLGLRYEGKAVFSDAPWVFEFETNAMYLFNPCAHMSAFRLMMRCLDRKGVKLNLRYWPSSLKFKASSLVQMHFNDVDKGFMSENPVDAMVHCVFDALTVMLEKSLASSIAAP